MTPEFAKSTVERTCGTSKYKGSSEREADGENGGNGGLYSS